MPHLRHHHLLLLRSIATAAAPPPSDSSLVLRLATVLYQQQNSTDSKLDAHLRRINIIQDKKHEILREICDKFPYSWRPVHRLHQHMLRNTNDGEGDGEFTNNAVSIAKLLSVYGKAKNIDLLWETFTEAAENGHINLRGLVVAAVALAEAREVKKCVAIFEHLQRSNLFSIRTFNLVVSTVCGERLVDVAQEVVRKIRPLIEPDGETYGLLVVGFCRVGDLVEASKIWNRMIDRGLEGSVEVYLEMVVTMFKNNRVEDGMKIFKLMRENKFGDFEIRCYGVVLDWLCKEGRILYACVLFGEMHKRGFDVDDGSVLASLVYGLLVRRRVRECYKVLQGIKDPDINLYHGLIKGLLRLKRADEATNVFREMIARGCEPIMHTYIMLLQGHFGKRGRKARDPMVNFDNIFVGGLIKAGKTLQATKYIERMMRGALEVPRFDYNKFLHYFSNEEGAVMFEEVGKRMMNVGMANLGYIFLTYGERMSTRDRRRRAMNGLTLAT